MLKNVTIEESGFGHSPVSSQTLKEQILLILHNYSRGQIPGDSSIIWITKWDKRGKLQTHFTHEYTG